MNKYFPSFNKYKELMYCENAGGSQIPIQVLNEFNRFITNNYLQPGGDNNLSKDVDKHLKEINNISNILLNNNEGYLLYGPSCTQLIFNLSCSIESFITRNNNCEIILTNLSHEACNSPFERIYKKYNMQINMWNHDINEKINYNDLLNKVNNNTVMVVLPHTSNLLGNTLDIEYITKEIKKKNQLTLILVDGVAYFPHNLVDVNKLNIDFYVISFYKFCGMRISLMYCKKSNINTINNVNHYFLKDLKDKKITLGGVNYELSSSIIGLKNYLIDFFKHYNDNDKTNKKCIERCYEHSDREEIIFNRELLEFVMSNINNSENAFIELFKKNINYNEIKIVEDTSLEKVPIFSIDYYNYDVKNISLILNEVGVICKTGTFYCDRYFDSNNLNKMNGLLRISLMHYNDIEDVKKIIYILNEFEKKDLNFTYELLKLNINNNIVSFIYLQDTFDKLEKDIYYKNERYRGFSLISIINNSIEIVGNLSFYQSNNYNNFNGNILRKYNNISEEVIDNNLFKDAIIQFNSIVNREYNKTNNYIQVHQIRVICNNNSVNLIPEGIHQDGFNIIAILCINRINVKGGVNNILTSKNSNSIVFSKELEHGEMIVINDIKFYHDVTNIELIDKNKIGHRDIFVFTTIS